MLVLTITLPFINTSLQVGDLLYYAPAGVLSGLGGMTSTNNVSLLVGPIVMFSLTTLTVLYDDAINLNPTPLPGDYLYFGKSAVANNTRLRGYYMELKMKNDSKDFAELYSVSSNIEESSK